MLQSRKRLRIFFKNLDFHAFRSSGWWLDRGLKVQSREVHRDFRISDRNSLMSGTFSREKHLENFSKVFLLSVLAVGSSDLHATWFSCKNRVFCANRSVFKCFQFFFPRIFVTFHYLPYLKHSQTHRVTLEQTSIFTSFQLKIFKKNVWVFSFSLHTSCFEFWLLESISCWFDLEYLLFRWWVGWMFVVFGFLGIVD